MILTDSVKLFRSCDNERLRHGRQDYCMKIIVPLNPTFDKSKLHANKLHHLDCSNNWFYSKEEKRQTIVTIMSSHHSITCKVDQHSGIDQYLQWQIEELLSIALKYRWSRQKKYKIYETKRTTDRRLKCFGYTA